MFRRNIRWQCAKTQIHSAQRSRHAAFHPSLSPCALLWLATGLPLSTIVLLGLLVYSTLLDSVVLAEADSGEAKEDPTTYPVCTSWIASKQEFGTIGVGSHLDKGEFCPQDHAYFAVLYPGNKRRPGAFVNISGTCCPLPAGVLLDETVYASEQCPDQFVATGSRQVIAAGSTIPTDDWFNETPQELRCTRIDSTRYQLGEITRGINLGWRRSFRTMFHSYVTRPKIPISLRIGLGRDSKYSWNDQICLGRPWGSVLVGKTSKYCDGMRFRLISPRKDLSTKKREELGVADATSFDYDRCLSLENTYEADARCRALKSRRMLEAERL